MRTSWAIGVAAIVAAAAGTAGAQDRPQQQQQKMQKQQAQQANPAMEATKHVAVVNAGLDTAETNAKMLQEITKDPQAYDRAHGQLFVKNIREALGQAQAHAAHLAPLATTDAQKQQYQQLQQSTARANQMAQSLQAKLGNPQQLNAAAGQLTQELDGTEKPLQQLAKDMNVQIDVG